LEGGDGLRLDDIVTCVASIAVTFALITAPLDMVLVSALGLEPGYNVSIIVSFLLSTMISGYIFAEKIREARRQTIARITVLWAALAMLLAAIVPATVTDWGPMAKEEYLAANPGATLSTSEWVNWEEMYLDIFMFSVVGVALVFGFIGLYVGSMLRRPLKSRIAKT